MENNTEQMRSEFLKWLSPSWNRETMVDDDGESVFIDDWVQGAWIGWQASRADLVVELPKSSGIDIAGFRVDTGDGSSLLTFRCEKELRDSGLIGNQDSVIPMSVIALETPKRGEVLVTVSGLTGSGKSAIAGEIEIAMMAIGVPVTWMNGDEEKCMTGSDWLSAIEMYNPKVKIVEINIPRAAGITVKDDS